MRYVSGSKALSGNPTRIFDLKEEVVWLRFTASADSVVVGRGLSAANSEGRAVAADASIEFPQIPGFFYRSDDFYASGAGSLTWEALVR